MVQDANEYAVAESTLLSRILGYIGTDSEGLQQEKARILGFNFADEYSEYTFGTWRSEVLFNGTGSKDDIRFKGYEGNVQPTELGKQLPYICSAIEKTFNTDLLKWVRVFFIQDGLLISHRDFIEFEKKFTRLHWVINADESCLHSENESVFHMREGEIWFLDASTVHSACSLGNFPRLSICLDFEGAGYPVEYLIKDNQVKMYRKAPKTIIRSEISDDFLEGLYGMGKVLNDFNYKDIVELVAKMHFYKKAHAQDVFDWIIAIAERSECTNLVSKFVDYRRFCIESREYGECFDL